MRPSRWSTIRRVAGKELALFFSSPIAYLFLASFAGVTLFVFFWGEAFFARNIADVRPMFEWMPLLLIFLTSTLTMRLWSEERRTGTLEHVLTQPVPLWTFVTGKFLGCLVLLTSALAITLPLPISVSYVGALDWGPVLAGYLATFLLGASYLSIGLFVSARSRNQIISLISSVAAGGCFYLVGSPMITELFTNTTADWLRALGTGSRFQDITRGVVDIRDLYYYLGMTLVFLTLNTYTLEAERWTKYNSPRHGRWQSITFLILANALGANLWLGQLDQLRIDVTQGAQYSITKATDKTLSRLREPLLIRGYFSSKTHPKLAPLVPQLKDLLREYEVAGQGRIRLELIDPTEEPELEQEANSEFGIKPVPFQVADRYQAAIVSSYFHVLVKYGTEQQVLGFQDLIEMKVQKGTELEVQLRNPEYDLTRTIKKLIDQYQAEGNLFDTVEGKIVLRAYISPMEGLPKQLQEYRAIVEETSKSLAETSNDRFSIEILDPDAGEGKLAKEILDKYGFQPMVMDLTNAQKFYFYITLAKEDQLVQISPTDMTKASFERDLKAGIKRFARGFTKTVALAGGSAQEFSALRDHLGQELNVVDEDLKDGSVSGEADLLAVLAPKDLQDKELFAIDQFLMRGGTVMLASSPFSAQLQQQRMSAEKITSGLERWLNHQGLSMEESMVLDPQSVALSVPVTRTVRGFQFQELRLLDYPYFVDVRGDGLQSEHPITSELPQATVAFASPIKVDLEKQKQRKVTELLTSSPAAWLSNSLELTPKLDHSGRSGFVPTGPTGSQLLGVVCSGRFDTYFADKGSPLDPKDENSSPLQTSLLKHSPDSAKLFLFSSNDFLRDQVIRIASMSSGGDNISALQMMANSVDWSLEDTDLLGIRSRGHFNRTLPPLSQKSQLVLECLNYLFAALALALVAMVRWVWHQRKLDAYAKLLEN